MAPGEKAQFFVISTVCHNVVIRVVTVHMVGGTKTCI